jgi:hypothetical protein
LKEILYFLPYHAQTTAYPLKNWCRAVFNAPELTSAKEIEGAKIL